MREFKFRVWDKKKKKFLFKMEEWDIPKNIHLDAGGSIIFNKNKQALWIEKGLFNISNSESWFRNYSDDFKLVRVKYEDIEVGDTITILSNEKPSDNKSHWYKIGESNYIYYVNQNNMITKYVTSNLGYDKLLKVVKK